MLLARALRCAGALLVFPGKGGEVRTKQGVYDIYKLALKRTRLDERLRWHDLRYTFASHWMMDGGCIFMLSKILGHSSVKSTEKVYTHLTRTAFEAATAGSRSTSRASQRRSTTSSATIAAASWSAHDGDLLGRLTTTPSREAARARVGGRGCAARCRGGSRCGIA